MSDFVEGLPLGDWLAGQKLTHREAAGLSLHEAKRAVDDLFTRVSEETLLNQPGMQPSPQEALRCYTPVMGNRDGLKR